MDYQYSMGVPHMRAHLRLDYHTRDDVPEEVRHAHYDGEVWEAAELMEAQLGDEFVGEELKDPAPPVFAFAALSPISPPHISILTRSASLLPSPLLPFA